MSDYKVSRMHKVIMEMYLRHLFGPKLQPITMTLEQGKRVYRQLSFRNINPYWSTFRGRVVGQK